jgi:4-amino-4-deoxy-L-arabinose transferase-like glycosyltransferase
MLVCKARRQSKQRSSFLRDSMKYLRLFLLVLACCLVVFLLTVHLESVPPLWWDEGWTLTVARSLAEFGHYGRFLAGQPTVRGLEAAFPMTGTVALSFHLFGVGIYQARIVAVIITLIALAILYQLARAFYGRDIGVVAVAVVVCLAGHVELNPLISGRQLVGEMPALLFLLTGYLCLMAAAKRPLLFVPCTVCLWALALFTKVQVKPFLIAALLVPIIFAIIQRRLRTAKIFGVCLIGSVACYLCLEYVFDRISPRSEVMGLTPAMAFVFARHVRLLVLSNVLKVGIPTLLGLTWGLWSFLKDPAQLQGHAGLVRLSLFVLGGSWFGWYVTLSVGWVRYMFPAAFVTSIFVAAMLSDWTNQFSLRSISKRAGSVWRPAGIRRETLAAFASIVLIVSSLAQTVKVLYGAHTVYADESIKDTISFLNNKTAPDALIETYESELLFLLNRSYHYPPDQLHVELLRRKLFGEKVQIDYNPLVADPDYLVAGPQSHWLQVYDASLESDFDLVSTYPKYRIYQRRRP